MYDMKSFGLAMSLIFGTAVLPQDAQAPVPFTSIIVEEVPENKQTLLGLYLSSRDAFVFLQQHPEALFIDTRDPVEIGNMGHPVGIDEIVPIRVQSAVYIEELDDYALAENPEFLPMWDTMMAERGLSYDDLIIITCGNGRRSALAVDALAAAGYTNVWHIVDGYAGEELEDQRGRNLQNAWQVAGLPWTQSNTLPGATYMRVIVE